MRYGFQYYIYVYTMSVECAMSWVMYIYHIFELIMQKIKNHRKTKKRKLPDKLNFETLIN